MENAVGDFEFGGVIPQPKRTEVLVVSVLEVEEACESRHLSHNLIAMSTHQRGLGFGSTIEAVLVFKRKGNQ
jgi:hypothetical protein